MNILYAILALGLLIVLHEAGHFLAARWCGMKVHEFAVGFGPKIFSFEAGGTTYTLRAIFLGGYVRIAGMHPAEEDAGEPDSFLGSAPWKRFVAILAGPVANYITAFLIFIAIYSIWGVRTDYAHVKEVKGGSALAKIGVKPGDQIVMVDKTVVKGQFGYGPELAFLQMLSSAESPEVTLKILRDGKQHDVKLSLPKKDAKSKKNKMELGVKAKLHQKLWLKEIKPDSFAAKMKLQKGDRLLKIADHKIEGLHTYLRYRKLRKKAAVKLEVMRAGKRVVVSLPAVKKGLKDNNDLPLKSEDIVVLSEVKPGSLGQAAGLQVGDQVLSVDKKPLKRVKGYSYEERLKSLLAGCAKKPLKLGIVRGDKDLVLTLPQKKEAALCTQGVDLKPLVRVVVSEVLPGSTAKKVGLRPGDWLQRIDGQSIHKIEELLTLLKARSYRPVTLTLMRQGKIVKKKVPMSKKAGDWKLGFRPVPIFARHRQGLGASMKLAALQTWQFNVRIWKGLQRIFSGQDKANLTGPVGIVNQTQQAVQFGFDYFLMFVSLISIHLAFFNLLPIPALDGGRIVFLFAQQVIRLFGWKDDVGVKIETIANVISFVLLFGLLILITFNDIYRLIFG